MCRWPLIAPTPLYSILWPIVDSILVTFGQICNFRKPQPSHFLFMYVPYRLNGEHFTFHLQNKYSGKFANRKYEELSYPKNPKMCYPFPAAHPHKEVTPPPGGLWMDERALSFLGIVYGVNNALIGLAVWHRKRRRTTVLSQKDLF